MVKPMLTDNGKFFWNLTAPVGENAVNNRDDVQLVQLGFYCMARNPATSLTAEDRAVYEAVEPGATLMGMPDDPVIVAIRHHQSRYRKFHDGKVSPVTKADGMFKTRQGGAEVFLLIPLVLSIYDAAPRYYPRIDMHPKCPWTLTEAIIQFTTF